MKINSYSILLINSKGEGSYLSVKGRTSWKTKKTAIKHKKDIENCKRKPFDFESVWLEDEYGAIIC